MRLGKPVGVGLGSYPAVSLKLARSKAEECRRLLAESRDPLTEKRAAEATLKLAQAKDKTFDVCAAEYIADHKDEWKNPKHHQQWQNTLATYASPIIGKRPIGKVTTADSEPCRRARLQSSSWPAARRRQQSRHSPTLS
jgi:hypothetical protein